MSGAEIPRRVRVATTIIMLLAPAGLLLVIDGLWELRWWASPSADHLVALLTDIKREFGVEPPVLLRGHTGAIELIVLGLLTMVPAFLALGVRSGHRTARTWVFVLAIATLAIGVAFIGSDATEPVTLQTYFANMHQGIAVDRIPDVKAALYPGWYSWVEDIAQGLQALAAVAAIGALAVAVIWHGDWFFGRGKSQPADDAWDAAISRLHQRTVKGPDDRP
ncbi:hypothetical protein [Actinoplanes sp. NPDC051411]|uniref:hypothetical protein n=1 Tax=Actinoplanes sp. NPDC051411 TaxID=3155522 RepID=UPI0034324311